MNVFTGLLIPFLGTTIGSAMVFLMKNKLNNNDKPEGIKAKLKKTTMMVFAVTLHNILEGRFQNRQYV